MRADLSRVLMKFALINPGGQTFWSNDTRVAGNGIPRSSVQVELVDGRFNIVLGRGSTPEIPDASIMSIVSVKLRVWVASTSGSFEQLSDQTLPTSAFLIGGDSQGGWRLTGTVLNTKGVSAVGIGIDNPRTTLDVAGETTTHVLTITGGSDIAEPFVPVDADKDQIRPGMIVVASDAEPGRIEISRRRADERVLGVVSGACDLEPGLTLRQEGSTHAAGGVPVALAGRVWCMADPGRGGIAIGDLLMSSSHAGVATRADRRRVGCTLGKALTALRGSPGMVLVLVGGR